MVNGRSVLADSAAELHKELSSGIEVLSQISVFLSKETSHNKKTAFDKNEK